MNISFEGKVPLVAGAASGLGLVAAKAFAESGAAVALTSGDLREIDSAASRITVQGARYPKHLERMTGL